jgi:hypothetical protein
MLPGETASAQVIAIKQNLQNVQLLLQLTLNNGRQLILPAESSAPLSIGTLLNITALSPTRLAAQLDSKAEPPLEHLDTNALPKGTLLQARVISSLPATGPEGKAAFKSIVTLLNSALVGKQLVIESPNELKPGSLLTAEVRNSQQIVLAPSSGRLDQIELGQQLIGQFQKQGSLTQLFQALTNLPGSSVPSPARDTLSQLLLSVPDVEDLADPDKVKALFERSGTLLERHLISGETARLSQDYKTLLLRLISQLNQGTATTTQILTAPASLPGLPGKVRSALSALGQADPRQAALSFPLPSRLVSALLEEGIELEDLVKLASSALSRLQTHQLSSVEQTQIRPNSSLLMTWQGELPMRDDKQISSLQYKLQEERSPKSQGDLRDSLWKLDLAFDLEPLGNLQVEAQLTHGTLSSQFWAEKKETAALITHELDHFRERLLELGLVVGELKCRQGKPTRGLRTHIEEKRWVDESA